MQEDMTVSFDPAYLEPRIPWFERLFILYLFSVLLISTYRVVRVAWGIRKLRKLEAETASSEGAEFLAYRDLCLRDAESFKKFSHLTLLLSLLVLAMGVTDVLMGIATVKVQVTSASAERIAEAIRPFSLGIVFCIVLYSCAMFFEALLVRRKSKRIHQQ